MYAKGGYSFYGQIIGILCLETKSPRILGHIKNAFTFNFPVRYKVVKGATIKRVVKEADPNLLEPFIKAAKELENEGVMAITSSCGFLSLFQKELSENLNVPVFTSSLMQVPLVHQMLGKNKKIGIITAIKECLTEKHLEAVGITPSIPIVITGMQDKEEFYDVIIEEKKDILDVEKLRKEVLEVAEGLVKMDPSVKAIVLECTDLTPFTPDIQKSLNLPVFDIISLTNYVYNSLVRKYNATCTFRSSLF